jgi:hypothetical protein
MTAARARRILQTLYFVSAVPITRARTLRDLRW